MIYRTVFEKFTPTALFAIRLVAFLYNFIVWATEFGLKGPGIFIYFTQWNYTLFVLYFLVRISFLQIFLPILCSHLTHRPRVSLLFHGSLLFLTSF